MYKNILITGGAGFIGSHLNYPDIALVSSSLFSNGKPIMYPELETEDFAQATLETKKGTIIRLSCSWNLHAGQDAIIEATFHGTLGGLSFQNIHGSFYDFEAHRYYLKTQKEVLTVPPDK